MLQRDELISLLKERQKNTVFETLGIRVDAYDPDAVVVSLDVDHRHLQFAGIVHGGIYVLLAESAASIAGALAVDITQFDVSGMEINANHLRPVSSGTIQATSKLIHQGQSTMIYGIDVVNDQGKLVSVSRCTLAIRKRRN